MAIFDTPCPRCGAICQLMAGVNVPGGQQDEAYLVCWKDLLKKRVAPGSEWQRIKGSSGR